jgi:antitoxin (DNA-binding transcriptional repressor) of toxin-antitoxin stability system
MTMNETMININEAKARLSKYARMVKQGKTIILCDRNRPFAELRPLAGAPGTRRPFGLAKGLLDLPADFNDLDPEVEALFQGKP